MSDRVWLVAAWVGSLLALAACGRMPAPTAHAAGSGGGRQAAMRSDPAAELAGGPDAVPGRAEPVAPSPQDPAISATPVGAAPPSPPAPEPPAAAPGIRDPLEQVNRQLYRLDTLANRMIAGRRSTLARLLPHLPSGAGHLIQNVVDNAQEPTTFANQMLQRRFGRALRTVVRFAVNSTAGLLGARDVAGRLGIKRAPTNFGQTLARYGVTPGPYLYLPLKGPTSVRDTAGLAIDAYVYPLHWLGFGTSATAAALHRAYTASRTAFMAARASARADRLHDAQAMPAGDGYALARTEYVRQGAIQEAAGPSRIPSDGQRELAMQQESLRRAGGRSLPAARVAPD